MEGSVMKAPILLTLLKIVKVCARARFALAVM